MTPISTVRAKLKNVREVGPKKWQASCPAHDDKAPSLSLAEKADGAVLVCCHAGCGQKAVIAAMGLQPRDLFPHDGHGKRRTPKVYPSVEAAAQEVARRARGVVEEIYRYTTTYCRVRVKTADGKTFRPVRAAGDGWALGDPLGLLPLYGAGQLGDGVTVYVYILEGEKATDAARSIGLVAVTSGSCTSAPKADWAPLAGRRVAILPDHDEPGEKYARAVARELRKLSPPATEIRVVRLPGLSEPGADIADFIVAKRAAGADDQAIRMEVEQLVAAAPLAVQPAASDEAPGCPYRATPHGLLYLKPTRDGDVPMPLTNFTAEIVAEVVHDDGVEARRLLEIKASLDGRTQTCTIPLPQFAALNWAMECLGSGAVVFAGFNAKEHAKVAIQLLSGRSDTRVIFTHTGWRRIGDLWAYLHASGAIGPNGPVPGVETAPPSGLDRYSLPEPPAGNELVAAIRASLKVLELGPPGIMFPLFCAAWRAVLAPAAFSIHLAGQTGTGKSELAALMQQHHGQTLTARNLPASWSSTGNSLEALGFSCKDALLTIDDFSPSGSQIDVQRFHAAADRVFRAAGNHSGRRRMRADSSLQPVKAPRCLILSTGEDVPKGHSVRARMLVLELGPSDLDWSRLTGCQHDAAAGLYAQVLSAFVCWMAGRYDAMLKSLPGDVVELRARATLSGQHRRVPEIVADLMVGLRYFLTFAVSAGAITAEADQELQRRAWVALGEAAAAQAAHHQASDPVRRFLLLLAAAISSGHAHVAGLDGGEPNDPAAWGWRHKLIGTGAYERAEWQPQGDRVGWVEGSALYLEPEASFRTAQMMGGGEPIPVSSKTLHKRLAERGLLVSTDTQRGRHPVRITIEEVRRYVLHLHVDSLMSGEPAQSAQSAHTPAPDAQKADSWADSWADSGPAKVEIGPRIGPLAAPERGFGPVGPIGPVPEIHKTTESAEAVATGGDGDTGDGEWTR
jgi:hypothetical protein